MSNRSTIKTDRKLQCAHGYNSSVSFNSLEIIGFKSIANEGVTIPNGMKMIIHSITVCQILAQQVITNFRWIIHTTPTSQNENILEGCVSSDSPTEYFKVPLVIRDVTNKVFVSVQNSADTDQAIHMFFKYEILPL